MLGWNQSDLVDEGGDMFITLSARGIEGQGTIAIGFGGRSMETADDFVICVVESKTSAECTDHSGPGARFNPLPDDEENNELDVVSMGVDGEWTSATFARSDEGTDDSVREGRAKSKEGLLHPLSDVIYLSQNTSIYLHTSRARGTASASTPTANAGRPRSTLRIARSLTSSALTPVSTTLSTAPWY
ncbi:unnamed protein product [Ectocarpus sp. 13 AM-2016]